jgi:hypothetical protein
MPARGTASWQSGSSTPGIPAQKKNKFNSLLAALLNLFFLRFGVSLEFLSKKLLTFTNRFIILQVGLYGSHPCPGNFLALNAALIPGLIFSIL